MSMVKNIFKLVSLLCISGYLFCMQEEGVKVKKRVRFEEVSIKSEQEKPKRACSANNSVGQSILCNISTHQHRSSPELVIFLKKLPTIWPRLYKLIIYQSGKYLVSDINKNASAKRILSWSQKEDSLKALSKILLFAAANKCLSLIQTLFVLGADINYKEIHSGDTPLIKATGTGDFDTVSTVISLNADLNATNTSGRSALITATINNDIEIIKLLLESGANVEGR